MLLPLSLLIYDRRMSEQVQNLSGDMASMKMAEGDNASNLTWQQKEALINRNLQVCWLLIYEVFK